MRVKIEQNEHGEHYFLIPDELQKELSWSEGDTIQWIDNGDGSCTLKKLSRLEALKAKAFENPDVKEEYDRISTSFNLDQQSFDAFDEVLNAPPKENEGIKDLLERKSPWDGAEEK